MRSKTVCFTGHRELPADDLPEISKRLKELYPDVQILPLDYDPDVSFANIENRLQMLIMNAREQEAEKNEATM